MKVFLTFLLVTVAIYCPQFAQSCDMIQGSICSNAMSTCFKMCGQQNLPCLCNCWKNIACPSCIPYGCLCFVPAGCNRPESKGSGAFVEEFLRAQSTTVQGKN